MKKSKEAEPDIRVVDVSQLVSREGENPNVMGPAEYAMLVEGIRKWGVLQPLTVRERVDINTGPDLEVIDGSHRLDAIKAVGITRVPVLVSKWGITDTEAQVLALNRIRGEVDVGRAAAMLRELQADGFEDLTLTGFSGGDIEHMLRDVVQGADVFSDLGTGIGNEDGEEREKVETSKKFAIRLTFDLAEDRDAVKAAALLAGPTVEAGLLNILRGNSS